MDNAYIGERIARSQMVLVGLGEEFDNRAGLRQCSEYGNGCNILKNEGLHWLIPGWKEFCAEKCKESSLEKSLEKLALLLENKNYFVVSVATSSRIAEYRWKENRLVMPCGTVLKKQCVNGCGDVLQEVTEADRKVMGKIYEELWNGVSPVRDRASLGVCPECGAPLILNNVYAENYNERGYLEQWKLYTKWLQGTLNRDLAVLELGVGMEFPSVIRWPFEKAAFFNRKAFFCRVNEKLYQLTEELAGKGGGISQNTIDWLEQL